jgi:hypothetical protein
LVRKTQQAEEEGGHLMILNRKARRAIAAVVAGSGLVIPTQAKLWAPPKLAIVRAESLRDIERAKVKALLPGFCIPMLVGAAAAEPTFVAAGTVATGSTSLSIPYYAGLQADDIAIVWAGANSNPTVGTIAGFTALTPISAGNFDAGLFWRRLTGGESGNVSLSMTGANQCVGVMIGIRGAITSGTPHEGHASTTEDNEDAEVAGPDLTTTGSNRLGIRFGYNDAGQTNASQLSDPPATWTERLDVLAHTSRVGLQIDTKEIASATTEGTGEREVFSDTSQVTGAIVQAFAIIPAT